MPNCIVIAPCPEDQASLAELASASTLFKEIWSFPSIEKGMQHCPEAKCILLSPEAGPQEEIRKLCSQAASRNIPVIAGRLRSMDSRILALEAGASECLPPDASLREGILRIRRQMEIKQRIDRLQEDRELFSRQALTDGLTGLYNRRYIQERLEAEVIRSNRSGEQMGVIIIDVDHFKQINDTHGHSIGDQVLQGIAQALKNCIRRSDIIGRYGGEEFVVLLPGVSAQNALSVTRKLHRRIAEVGRPYKVQVTVSMGISVSDPSTPRSPQYLFEEADQALYAAKREGRNRTVLFRAPVTPSAPPLLAFKT